jgi:hypothetical protein
MGFFLGDPFSHSSMSALRKMSAESKTFNSDRDLYGGINLYECYHWVLTTALANQISSSSWRINVVENDVAVLSFWTLPSGLWTQKLDFYHEDTTGTWSEVSDSFSTLQYTAIANVSTESELTSYISTQVANFDAAYGSNTSSTDYDTCFYQSYVWQRTQMPVWTSDDSTCDTCGSNNAPMNISIYEWTKGTEVEYRSSTSCPTTNSCCQITSSDLVSLQTQLTDELITRCDGVYMPPPGCMSENASNYNATATEPCTDCCTCNAGYVNVDDGCAERVNGCLDSNSLEYNSNANTDDGSCISCTSGFIKNTLGICDDCDTGYTKDAAGNCYSETEESETNWILILAVAGIAVMALS